MSHARDAEDARLLASGEYARLLAVYDPVIVQRCVAALKGSLDAEDVAQDVKLRLYRELRGGKTYPVPFRVVVHKVIDWTVKEYFDGRPTDVPVPEGWEPSSEDDSIGPMYVESLIADLPPRDREVAALHLVEGLSPAQIAARLGMHRNAVDQALHRARVKLREALAAHG
ncbi:MAG: hypothetical protein C4305_02495 [Thermoleophilia bacterium]